MGSIKRKFGNNITSGKFDATDLTGTIPASNVANASLTSVTALPGISGDFIQTVASDPPAPDFGDIWYNSTEQKLKLKTQSIPAGTWASGGNLNTGRFGLGGAGTQTATIAFAGGGGTPAGRGETELYDGTSWTEVNDLNTARYLSGKQALGATSTASICVSGYTYAPLPVGNVNNVETWDGTNWTEVNDVNVARRGAGAAGTSTAGLFFAGKPPTPGFTAANESWDGTNWTETTDVNTAREDVGSLGIQTAALLISGSDPVGKTAVVEQWDGSTWTEVGDLNTARYGSAGSGTVNAGLAVAGNIPPASNSTLTEYWNGTSWTEIADVSTAVNKGASGTTGAASSIHFGGSNPPGYSTATDEFTAATPNQSIQGS